jgi:hypothetical protein
VAVSVRLDRAELPGWVMDRSSIGLGVQVPVEVPAGTRVFLRPKAAPENVPWVEVEVRYCRALGRTHYALGASFREAPPWSTLLLFG